jgi:hypothetical protein
MTTIGAINTGIRSPPNLLDRERIIAGKAFNRWLVPPAALSIHLCIGMAYGAAAPVLAGTAVVPPNGETTYVTHYTGRVIDTEYLGDGASESLVVMTGVTRNAVVPAFDAMNSHCLMFSAIIGGKTSASGACTQTDRGGDHVFTSFDGAAFKLIGGTGKYKGISGSALYSITPEPSLAPGRNGYVMKNDVTWTIQAAPPAADGEAVVRGGSAKSR